MTQWIKHSEWAWIFWCLCGRIHWFRERHYAPPVENAFIAENPWDRHGPRTRVAARYSLVCKCGMGHYKIAE